MTKTPGKTKWVELHNPVSDHFDKFIFGNSAIREKHNLPVILKDSGKGKSVVICGAGPSLRDHVKHTKRAKAVWGCNSALNWLMENGHKCTHGFSLDQTEHMLDEWKKVYPVNYYLGSSVHPRLTEHILAQNRRITFFHNYVGMQNPEKWTSTQRYEDFLYATLWPATVRVGDGLNSANRAVCLAIYMGYSKITVLGADCAMNEKDELHADGGGITAFGATPMTFVGEIDGRTWRTKPDMVISAVMFVRMKRTYGDRIQIIGDTLPNALMDKDDEYLDRLPRMTSSLVPEK